MLGGLVIGLIETFWSAISHRIQGRGGVLNARHRAHLLPTGLLGRPETEKV
jgi:hypothetical protein